MSVMNVVANAPYPNRLQLVCDPYIGPFEQEGPLGLFDPARDLRIYVDGVLQTVQTSYFDSVNNRYLVFMTQAFNLQGFVQVVHHVPNPPFQDANSVELVGFALIGNFTPSSDVLAPQMVLVADPATVPFGTPSTTLLWATTGVEQVIITGSNGLNTGFLGPSGIYILFFNSFLFQEDGSSEFILENDSGAILLENVQGIGTITLTMRGYDAGGNPIFVGSPPAQVTTHASVTIT